MDGVNLSLDGRVALITGAGRGIGLGMARAMADAGCVMVLQDIDLNAAETEAATIRASGGRALALGGDVTDASLPGRLIFETLEQCSGLHILINNAAIQCDRSWLDCPPADIELEWRANMLTPILLAQLAVPIFRKQKWGRIINLGSIQGKNGNPHMLPYAMSKAAMENVTRAWARELAKENITVNMIAPGYFNTWRNRDQFRTPQDLVDRGKWVPAGRIGEPADCAGLALLLCSDCGSYITGQTIYVDGGLSVR